MPIMTSVVMTGRLMNSVVKFMYGGKSEREEPESQSVQDQKHYRRERRDAEKRRETQRTTRTSRSGSRTGSIWNRRGKEKCLFLFSSAFLCPRRPLTVKLLVFLCVKNGINHP